MKRYYDWSLVDKWPFFWLCVTVSIVLRAYLAADTTFWLDELWSAGFSQPSQDVATVIRLTLADVHPPLYQILLHYWFIAFGFTELSARMLSLVAGVLCIPVFHLLAYRLLPAQQARIASLLFAMNLAGICFAAEVRSYECLLLLALSATYAMAVWIIEGKRIMLCGYVFAGIALMYTHYFGLVLLLAHGLVVVTMLCKAPNNQRLWGLMAAFILLLLALLPIVPFILGNADRASFWIKNPGVIEWLSYSLILFGGPFALPLLAIWVWMMKGATRMVYREELMLLAVLAILLAPYLAGFFMNPMLTARNAIIAVPFLCLLLARPVANAALKWRAVFLLYAFALVLLGFILVPVYKGEDLDVLLQQVKVSQRPLMIVNDKELATDGFVQTKIDLQPQQYAGIRSLAWSGNVESGINEFWLACYHTCFRLQLDDYMPKGFQTIKQIKARGVEGRLLKRIPQ